MRLRVTPRVLSCSCVLMLCGCGNYRFERHVVFDGPAATRIDRVRQYSLEEQYKIFRYGNDVVEPPLMELAKPIAERGAAAVPFLLRQLSDESDDTTVRDVLLIFQEMSFSKTYDVKNDKVVMATLETKVSEMKASDWRRVCSKMLGSVRGD